MSAGRCVLRDYEAVYIFDSALEESRIGEKIERYHGLLTGENGGEITAVDHWGKRQLAYPIQDRDNGYYVVTHFTASPTALPEYERVLKLDEELLRYMVVINEGELSTTPVMPEPPKSDDDDEDEEE
jgi:small subunit ribosomal protein S6